MSISYKQLFHSVLYSSKLGLGKISFYVRWTRKKMNFIWSYFLNGKLIKRWYERKSFAFSFKLCFFPFSRSHSWTSTEKVLLEQFFFPHTLLVVYLECKYMIYHFITTFTSGKDMERRGKSKNNSWKQNHKILQHSTFLSFSSGKISFQLFCFIISSQQNE